MKTQTQKLNGFFSHQDAKKIKKIPSGYKLILTYNRSGNLLKKTSKKNSNPSFELT